MYVVDIETEEVPDYRPNVIWCMCYEEVTTGETGDCIGHAEIVAFFESHPDAIFVGHNALKFDFEVLGRVVGADIPITRRIDTLVLSQLYSPNIPGGHSLEEWGLRIGKAKGEFHDFSKFSQEMLIYCRQDVKITAELFRRLIRTMARIGFTERSIWIQHRFMALLHRQQRNGFYFDGPRAITFLTMLRGKEQELLDEIRVAFPPEQRLVATRQMYTKNGRHTAVYERDRERYDVVPIDGGPEYRAFEDVPFNVGSPKQRVDRLTGLGWKPEEFTEKGGPTPFIKGKLAPSLERFLESHDVPEACLMARYMTINGRGNMVNTWLNEWNQNDWCIHGKLFVADTLRLRHQSPNTANIPGVRVSKDGKVLYGDDGDYTYEARDLWTARPGRVLVGTDAAGLELRMLAHFLNRPAFTDTVINGDPHQYNADTVGISRPLAKTLL